MVSPTDPYEDDTPIVIEGITTPINQAVPNSVLDATVFILNWIQGAFSNHGGRILDLEARVYALEQGTQPGVAPTVDPETSFDVTDTTATFECFVDPHGEVFTWRLEYGTTTSYGSYFPVGQAGDGSTQPQTVSAHITGLTPNALYHARWTATNATGTTNSADFTFTTDPAPSVPTITHTATIQDTNIGAGTNVVNYVPASSGVAWVDCGGCLPTTTDGHHHYDYTAGNYMVISFTGVRLVVYAAEDYSGARAAETRVDGFLVDSADYADFNPSNKSTPTARNVIEVFDTGVLGDTDAAHTVAFTVPASAPRVVTFDRAHVYTSSLAPDPTAPSVVASPATAVTTTTATLNGSVNENGEDAVYHFEYGTTTAYGTSTPGSPAAVAGTDGFSPVAVSANLTGLSNATDYHFKLVATNSEGTTETPDIVFRTGSVSPPVAGYGPWGGSRDTNSSVSATEWYPEKTGKTIAVGRQVQEAFPTRDAGWGNLLSVTSGQVGQNQFKRRTLIMLAPFPRGGYTYSGFVGPSNSNTPGSTPNEYDAQWQAFGSRLAQRAADGWDDILCLNWEFNGRYMFWGRQAAGQGSATQGYTSAAQFVATFQRQVANLRRTFPAVKTAWIINGWGTPDFAGADGAWNNLYPGDGYVTYIGGDWYDHSPFNLSNSSPDSDYVTRFAQTDGPQLLLNKVRAAGTDALGRAKQFLVPEWGCDQEDNPKYIRMMNQMLQGAYASGHLAGEIYYNEQRGSSWSLDNKPNALAEYKRIYTALA